MSGILDFINEIVEMFWGLIILFILGAIICLILWAITGINLFEPRGEPLNCFG